MKIMNMENDRTGRFSMLVNRKKSQKRKSRRNSKKLSKKVLSISFHPTFSRDDLLVIMICTMFRCDANVHSTQTRARNLSLIHPIVFSSSRSEETKVWATREAGELPTNPRGSNANDTAFLAGSEDIKTALA